MTMSGWIAAIALSVLAQEPAPTVRVGSKTFTESVILGEIAHQLLMDADVPSVHRRELGGTQVLFHALEADELDVYPEYTGTIGGEILAGKGIRGEEAMRAALAGRGIGMSRPLGFNDTYAIGMREDVAARLGIRTLSDLRKHPEVKLAFSNEFMERADGWPGLRDRYGLPQRDVRGLDHDLAYRAMQGDEIQATDLYSTDAEIRAYRLRVLDDDRKFFPSYECVWLYRSDLPARSPAAMKALDRLAGKIDVREMANMNARAKIDRLTEDRVAAEFVAKTFGVDARIVVEGRARRLLRRLGEHLTLVGISLGAAILVAIPLGVVAARRPRLGSGILAAAGIVQTIPSLALLVFMIPWLGIGAEPALVALFLYSLLPIIRNTCSGLHAIAAPMRESAVALGLPEGARLRLVELPLATRSILAGIKTSAVINIGTATLGALVGAGGYGQPILTGIRLNDFGLIVEGAVPAALLALIVQTLFDGLERRILPRSGGI